MSDEKPAICLVGHGSRDTEGTEEFHALVERIRARCPDQIVESGFLEFAEPVIQDAFDRCVQRGARAIAALPGMLMAAGHAKNDVPSEVNEAQQRHQEIPIRLARHLHLHPKILRLCQKRIEEAEAAAEEESPGRENTLLVVAGRGSSDPDANADVHKVTRLLWEGLGFGWAETCYSGVTRPLLKHALPYCQRLGFERVLVLPFFMFTGRLEKRIREQTQAFDAVHPDQKFLCAPYLNADDLLVDVFLERAHETFAGEPNMNCQMCKYRVQIPGFEEAVGAVQAGHHHHVRGAGQDGHDHHHHDHAHGHSHHGHDHGHDPTHHAPPHAH
jgi:sirohydrochlorin cobaltochelatase